MLELVPFTAVYSLKPASTTIDGLLIQVTSASTESAKAGPDMNADIKNLA